MGKPVEDFPAPWISEFVDKRLERAERIRAIAGFLLNNLEESKIAPGYIIKKDAYDKVERMSKRFIEKFGSADFLANKTSGVIWSNREAFGLFGLDSGGSWIIYNGCGVLVDDTFSR